LPRDDAVGREEWSGAVLPFTWHSPQAILSWTTGTPFGTLLRAINDAGLDIPVSSSTGNMSFAQMEQYKSFLPKQLYFAGLRSISRLGTAGGPVRDAQAVYFNAFKTIGVRPDVINALVIDKWDPVTSDFVAASGPGGFLKKP
jgi:branched-chain amino acid transport system substrate-binding protein